MGEQVAARLNWKVKLPMEELNDSLIPETVVGV